jgi:uncharacterized protein (UPF0297 family)
MPGEDTAAENLRRLAESEILSDFVKRHDGEWDHPAWLSLYQILEDEGYTPIDFDRVGLLLEDKRSEYFNNRQ